MAEKIPPDEVARLDPFGKREIPASRKLEELLAERETREPELKEFEADLIMVEQEAWKRVLGVNFTIPPLPTEITQEVKQKLEEEGFTLVFLPPLDLDPYQLGRENLTQYLRRLTAKYPNWKRFESLSESEKNKYQIYRNLEMFYWEKVQGDWADFPRRPGQWLAVETLEKPSHGEKYQETNFGKRLGIDDRFNVSWNDIKAAIDEAKQKFLSDVGLVKGDVHLLDILPWNLLANRFGWGKTNTYEWTNTECRHEVRSSLRFMVGNLYDGGAAHVLLKYANQSYPEVGFRIAVEIGS